MCRNFNKNVFLNRDGFSIVSLLAVVGVTTVMIMASTSSFRQSHVVRSSSRLSDGKAAVVEKITRYSSLAASIRNTMIQPGNDELRNCIMNNGACSSVVQRPVTLYGPAVPGNQMPMAGTRNSPVRYDQWGMICDAHKVDCPIEVTTEFIGACSKGQGACPSPDSVKILFELKEKIPGSTGLSSTTSISGEGVAMMDKILSTGKTSGRGSKSTSSYSAPGQNK